MPSLGIVEHLDVIKFISASLFASVVHLALDTLSGIHVELSLRTPWASGRLSSMFGSHTPYGGFSLGNMLGVRFFSE